MFKTTLYLMRKFWLIKYHLRTILIPPLLAFRLILNQLLVSSLLRLKGLITFVPCKIQTCKLTLLTDLIIAFSLVSKKLISVLSPILLIQFRLLELLIAIHIIRKLETPLQWQRWKQGNIETQGGLILVKLRLKNEQ